MPGNPTNKNAIIRDLLKQFPKVSKAAIARKAVDLYPTLFEFENARTMVRAITGANGVKNNSINPAKYEAPELPPSRASERKFFRVERKNILWLSDIHIPNQNNEALNLAVNYGLEKNVDCIILGGDIMDNTPFTAHDAPPPSPNDVRDFFEMTQTFLNWLRSKFPKAHIIWIEGNHDNWLMRWLMKKAPILFNDPYYHLPQRLNLKKYNVDFLEQHIIVKMGKLYGSHGHTIVKGVFAPVNAARGAFVKTKSNYIIGHVHSTSHHGESNIKEDAIGCWSVGCLCELSPSYDPHNTKHNLGFARIIVEDNGDFTVENKRIFKGKIV
jgi:predicted phosphodiesterase